MNIESIFKKIKSIEKQGFIDADSRIDIIEDLTTYQIEQEQLREKTEAQLQEALSALSNIPDDFDGAPKGVESVMIAANSSKVKTKYRK